MSMYEANDLCCTTKMFLVYHGHRWFNDQKIACSSCNKDKYTRVFITLKIYVVHCDNLKIG